MPENLDSEQRARLWEHRLEIEKLLFSRLTIFLTYETILLAVFGALYSKTGQDQRFSASSPRCISAW